MVISFPFDIFTWKHLIGGISNPESLDRYVLMICDLCSPSSVYYCNRREVIPVWPLWLCWWDTSCPHQTSEAAYRSVKLFLSFSMFSAAKNCHPGCRIKNNNIAHCNPRGVSLDCSFCLYKLICNLGSILNVFLITCFSLR